MPDWTLKADVGRAKVSDMERLTPQLAKGRMGALNEALALIVTECPADWGRPDDPQSYDVFSVFSPEKRILHQFYVDTVKVATTPIEGVTFDFSTIRAAEFDSLLENARQIDVVSSINLLSRFMATCPFLPDIKDAEAYRHLKFFTEFRPLVIQMIEAASEQMRNFLNPSGAT